MKISIAITSLLAGSLVFATSSLANNCHKSLDYAASNYNASVDTYNQGQQHLEAAKKSNTCKNLENAFNKFATAFGGFGAGVSHASIAKSICNGADKNTAIEYLETIRNGYVQGARATYLSSGLHYKSCNKKLLNAPTKEILEAIDSSDTQLSLDHID
jgi:hypothetical protein